MPVYCINGMKSLPGNIFMSQAFDIVSRITERSGQLRLAEQKVAEAILEDFVTRPVPALVNWRKRPASALPA